MNSVSFELWNQWLDTTRKSQFLYSLQNRDLLNRWAEAAFQVIRHTNFSLRHLFEQKLQEHPRKVLFRDMSGEMSSQWSYEQINRHMKEIAATFYTIISEEPRVAIWTENSVESACCDLACLFYDILISPINVHFDIKNLHYIFKKLS